jgi:hypothetical protein
MSEYRDLKDVRFEGNCHLRFSSYDKPYDFTLSNPIFPPKWDELQKKLNDSQRIIVRKEEYKKRGAETRFAVRIQFKDVPEIYIQCGSISGYHE